MPAFAPGVVPLAVAPVLVRASLPGHRSERGFPPEAGSSPGLVSVLPAVFEAMEDFSSLAGYLAVLPVPFALPVASAVAEEVISRSVAAPRASALAVALLETEMGLTEMPAGCCFCPSSSSSWWAALEILARLAASELLGSYSPARAR